MDLQEKIKTYSDLKEEVDAILTEKNKQIIEIAKLSDEQRAQISLIESERDTLTASYDVSIQELATEIKEAVLEEGATLKGDRWQFVLNKPRKKILPTVDGYLKAHGVFDEYVSFGKPTVSIRPVKQVDEDYNPNNHISKLKMNGVK